MPELAGGGAGNPAADRDGHLVLRDSAGGGGWHSAVAAGAPGFGTRGSNSAGRGHSGDRSRTPRYTRGKLVAGEQPRHESSSTLPGGVDNGDRSWQGRGHL